MYPDDQNIPDNSNDTPQQKPVKYVYWMDDDAATMSLLGCMGQLFIPLIWLTLYAGHRLTFNDLASQDGAELVGLAIASAIALLASVYFFGVKKHHLEKPNH